MAPRPREFDEETVLSLAMHVFWRYGYEASSLSHLMEATGLAKGSIYKGFKDKRSLFLRCLTLYLEDGNHQASQMLQSSSGAEGLERWLHLIVDLATSAKPRLGCFGINTAVELAAEDAEIRQLLKAANKRLAKLCREAIDRGKKDGSIAPAIDSDVLIGHLQIFVAGLQVHGKLGMSKKQAMAQVEFVLRGLQ